MALPGGCSLWNAAEITLLVLDAIEIRGLQSSAPLIILGWACRAHLRGIS